MKKEKTPVTDEQRKKYAKSLTDYVTYIKDFIKTVVASSDPTPPNGPKNPPKFP